MVTQLLIHLICYLPFHIVTFAYNMHHEKRYTIYTKNINTITEYILTVKCFLGVSCGVVGRSSLAEEK